MNWRKILLQISLLLISASSFTQEEYKPYNDDLNFKVILASEVLPKTESIKALFVVFGTETFTDQFTQTLKNNPQLIELQLIYPNQQAITVLVNTISDKTTHVFLKNYNEEQLSLQTLARVELLSISSVKMKSLSMSNATFNQLGILAIEADQLKVWTTNTSFPKLELIDLIAPKLTIFPITSMPAIYQFSYNCSLKELPKNLCSYTELELISFTNYGEIQIDECFKQKVAKGVYSNITVWDEIDGKVITELVSDDRK